MAHERHSVFDEAGGHWDRMLEQNLRVGFALGVIAQRGSVVAAEHVMQEKINRV